MRIQPATARDMEAIAVLWPVAELGPWSPEAEALWWVVADGRAVAGFASAKADEHGDVDLTSAYVDPRYRGRGLHARLIRVRIRWAKKIGAGRVSTYTWGGNLPSMRALIRARFVMVSRTWDGERSWITWSREL